MLRKTVHRHVARALKSTAPTCQPLAVALQRTLSSQPVLQQCRCSSSHVLTKTPSRRQFHTTRASWLALPSHTVMPMPALSPTMTEGSIGKWILKVGDRFDAGASICEIETDKASVSLDAQDEGFIAKILVSAGETIQVGAPIVVTVSDADDVAAFANYTANLALTTTPVSAPAPAPAAATAVAAPTPTPAATPAPASAASSAVAASSASGGRVFASPLARKLAREGGLDISALRVPGTGPGGRIVAADVLRAAALPADAAPGTVATTTTTAPKAAAAAAAAVVAGIPMVTATAPVVRAGEGYSDFELSALSSALAARLAAAKQQVPHYYLSVELDLTKLLRLRAELNGSQTASSSSGGISVTDCMVKAAALAMRAVPDVNAQWMGTFVRQYEQVDVNLVMGAGSFVCAPVIRDAAAKGLSGISAAVAAFEDDLFGEDGQAAVLQSDAMAVGTFSIHNLGVFGVKAASPIVLAPQACALALGAIIDTVVPDPGAEKKWKVSPVMTATLSCDHRVVDGAVGAQWLAAFKALVENPITMVL